MCTDTTFERHYTPSELAELWRLDESTIRRIFMDEPGVLIHGNENLRKGKRQYLTLRIPTSVAERVHKRRTR